MAFELRQELKLSQQLVMTMQLQQAIKLLQLSHLELVELLQEEMKENPVLIDSELEANVVDSADVVKISEKEQEIADEFQTDPYADDSKKYEEYYAGASNYSPIYTETEDKDQFESIVIKKTSLIDYLTWQLRLSVITDPDKEVGVMIINNLNDDGYMIYPTKELSEMYNVNEADILKVLKVIQDFDPPGVGARNLKECLLKQAENLSLKNSIVEHIINDHLKNLEKRNYKAIAKSLSTSIDNVYDACKVILSMEPRPGRVFSTEDVHYITPDIYIYKIGDNHVVSLNEDGMPKLRVSQYYKSILNDDGESESSKVTKEYIHNKLRSAEWLIRSIHQRQRTIFKVAESILKFQKDFFDYGVGHLKPLILRDVAEDIGRHESTVSRVTSNKYVYTPHGLFMLSYFFTNSVESNVGEEKISTENVKERIKDLISNEDKSNPLSDQDISEILMKENINIARRTVAKYREGYKILPSKMRRRAF